VVLKYSSTERENRSKEVNMDELRLPKVITDSILPYCLNDAIRYLIEILRREKVSCQGVFPEKIEEGDLLPIAVANISLLIGVIDHPDDTIRFAVAAVLAKFKPSSDQIFEYLVSRLTDKNRYVRIVAIQGLSRYMSPEATKEILSRSKPENEADAEIREYASEAGEALEGRIVLKELEAEEVDE
jgi:HEAT repeat protein